jgi:hypothetical protein
MAGVALLVPLAVSAETAGPMLRVLDGDTYEMMLEGFPTRVRLANADTPETGSRAKCARELERRHRHDRRRGFGRTLGEERTRAMVCRRAAAGVVWGAVKCMRATHRTNTRAGTFVAAFSAHVLASA